jgi:hypothetical protein
MVVLGMGAVTAVFASPVASLRSWRATWHAIGNEG